MKLGATVLTFSRVDGTQTQNRRLPMTTSAIDILAAIKVP